MSPHFSFEVVNALDYDELRPGYAPDAVAWVAERGRLAPGLIVVDLAAGTGQLSRRFMPLGVDLVAVEPAENMRAVLEERLPAVRVLEGTAESIPLDAGSVDAVLIAGDDPNAKKVVFGLARDMGFDPVDVGPLKATRDLERLVGLMLFVRLGPLRVLSRGSANSR
jgi:SAM-dependent methyltransferase